MTIFGMIHPSSFILHPSDMTLLCMAVGVILAFQDQRPEPSTSGRRVPLGVEGATLSSPRDTVPERVE